MRNLWNKCVYILILQFVLVPVVLSNTLMVDEAGNVLAETDRYVARFEKGVLMHFHNKLTNETYTQGESETFTRLMVSGRRLTLHELTPEIKKISPLEYELIYQDTWSVPHSNEVMLHLFIGIDAETGELLIRQKGTSKTGGIVSMTWEFANLSHVVVDFILPYDGGQIITQSDGYHYPGSWEAQLAILQGQRGGVSVRSDDTQFRFKSLEYFRDNDSFALDFISYTLEPFESQKQFTTATWRLNAYQGDWQVPALAYKQWMHEALKPADRAQMPAWVNDIEAVILCPFYPVDMEADILGKLSQLVDPEKTLLYTTDWRESGWALNFPDYTPVTSFANFEFFFTEAKRYGFKVMLHANMVAVALSNPLYAEFEKYQMYKPLSGQKMGQRLSEANPLSVQYAWINPASRSFREMLVEQLKGVWDTYKVDAFHLDISTVIENNAPIDGLTMSEGNILLHQELREAMPGIVLGGEHLHEVTFLHESFAQRGELPPTEQAHPISSFLFSSYVRPYGHLGIPNPDRYPEIFKDFLEEYEVWNVIPTLRLNGVSDLDPDRVETHRLLELVRERQNWRFGDVNSDGVVNIQDLVIVANALGKAEPDLNGDGVVNIQDLVLVANAFE